MSNTLKLFENIQKNLNEENRNDWYYSNKNIAINGVNYIDDDKMINRVMQLGYNEEQAKDIISHNKYIYFPNVKNYNDLGKAYLKYYGYRKLYKIVNYYFNIGEYFKSPEYFEAIDDMDDELIKEFRQDIEDNIANQESLYNLIDLNIIIKYLNFEKFSKDYQELEKTNINGKFIDDGYMEVERLSEEDK